MRLISITLIAAILSLCTKVLAGSIPEQVRFDTKNERDQDFVKALHAVLPASLDILDAPGLQIAVARGGEVIFEGAYGWSDVEDQRPMTIDTVFHSGSMGKVYTGVAIMQLVERGVIALDHPINKYLPFAVENPLGGDEITVFHLMTHSSGLNFDAAGAEFEPKRSLEEMVRYGYSLDRQRIMGGGETWAYRTGEGRIYSNIGMATLGLIVERANPEGLNYSDFVEKNIMQALDMTSSQYPPAQTKDYIRPDIWERMSTGYNTLGDVWIETLHTHIGSFPAGGFVSTPRDHVRLLLAFLNAGELDEARVLKPESVEQMLTITGASPHPGLSESKLGLVWFLTDWNTPGKRKFHHGGGHMFGWRTQAMAWPEHDTAVVYAFNEWSAGVAKSYYGLVDGLIETLLVSAPPRRPSQSISKIENLAWKASYLRGLFFVEGYRYSIGIPGALDSEKVEQISNGAVEAMWADGQAPQWDKDAFLQGVKDMSAVEPTTEAIHRFATSNAMKITLEEARLIAPWLGASNPETGLLKPAFSSLAGLLASDELLP